MIDLDNAELQNALQIIQFTRRSLFLTGKAGTGKSTFLRYIAANTKKKHIVLAPTGIAAINAGLKSPQSVAAKLGLDYEDLLVEIKAAEQLRQAIGITLPSELAALAAAKGTAAAANGKTA